MAGVQNIEKIVLPRGVTKVDISLYRYCSLSIFKVIVYIYPFEVQWFLYTSTTKLNIRKFIFVKSV
jgi:hypothetical protein